MGIKSFSKDSLEKINEIFTHDIQARGKNSIAFIKNKYTQCDLFYKAVDFIQHDNFINMMKFGQSTNGLENYSILEAHNELIWAIQHALIGSYKAAFGNLRKQI